MKTVTLLFALSFSLSMAAMASNSPKASSKAPRVYIMMKHGKLIEVNHGVKKPVRKNVYLVNQSTIHPNGSIDAGSGQSLQLKEGQYITMDGKIRELKNMPVTSH